MDVVGKGMEICVFGSVEGMGDGMWKGGLIEMSKLGRKIVEVFLGKVVNVGGGVEWL